MNTIKEIKNLKDKKVLLRVDLDVPVNDDEIGESFRVVKQRPMVDHLVANGAQVVMVAHISAINSFEPILSQVKNTLGHEISFIRDLTQLGKLEQPSQLMLLDNIRKWSGEKNNDKELAKQLADSFDLYINNCFAVSHRNHASVSAITGFLPSYAGFLIEEEIFELEKIISMSKEGKIMIIGGAKAETKVPVIKNFLDKSERIILGGVVANDILKERGIGIDGSVADENSRDLLRGLDIYDERLVLPEDYNAPEGKISDIGSSALIRFADLVKNAKIIVWNGPLGIFEDERFAGGTNGIAQAIVSSECIKMIGGGDTIAAVSKLGLLGKFDFVSTGGGAMLAFLAGEKLPGLKALGYYN